MTNVAVATICASVWKEEVIRKAGAGGVPSHLSTRRGVSGLGNPLNEIRGAVFNDDIANNALCDNGNQMDNSKRSNVCTSNSDISNDFMLLPTIVNSSSSSPILLKFYVGIGYMAATMPQREGRNGLLKLNLCIIRGLRKG